MMKIIFVPADVDKYDSYLIMGSLTDYRHAYKELRNMFGGVLPPGLTTHHGEGYFDRWFEFPNGSSITITNEYDYHHNGSW